MTRDPVLVALVDGALAIYLENVLGKVRGSAFVHLGVDTPGDFDWRPHGSNTFDAATASFFEAHPPGTLTCVSVAANNSGSIELLLDAGYVLRLSPNGSRMEEFWRYFQPDTSGEDVVVFNDRE